MVTVNESYLCKLLLNKLEIFLFSITDNNSKFSVKMYINEKNNAYTYNKIYFLCNKNDLTDWQCILWMFSFGYQRTMTGENKEKECKATKDLKGNIKKSIDEAEWSRDFRNFYRYRNTSLAIKTTFFMSVNITKTPLQSLGFLKD